MLRLNEACRTATGNRTKPTTFRTFTAAGRVRRALMARGFKVEKVSGFAGKREMSHGTLLRPSNEITHLPWFKVSQSGHQKKHAIIVGAGIAGITSAWALAQRGWQVDLIEQHGSIAREGSGNPLGIVLPRISLNESTESTFFTTAYVKAILQLSRLKNEDPNFSWQQGGVLQLPVSSRIHKQIAEIRSDPDFLQAVSPEEASQIAGIRIRSKALYFPQAGWLNPVDLCERLIKKSEGRLNIHFNTTITRLYSQAGKWQLFDQNDQVRFESEVIVLTNAAHAKKFQQTNWLPLEPARGQISVRAATKMSSNLRCAICYEGYVLPEHSGTHVVGATFDRGDSRTELRTRDDNENFRHLALHFPGIFDLAVDEYQGTLLKGRAAIRALTPDRMPMVGPVADVDYFKSHYHDLNKGKAASNYADAKYLRGLYLNVGHGAKGLCSSFLSAELLVTQINNESLPVSKTLQNALNPSRFIIRNLRKKRSGQHP